MPSREFPAPPNLSDLLKFFESNEGKARVNRQNGGHVSRVKPQRNSQAVGSKHLKASRVLNTASTSTPVTAVNCQLSKAVANEHKSIRDVKIPHDQGWNSSTQVSEAPVKTLRHQILSRAYQPPAPVYVVPSEASGLMDRLSKGTISSRSKLKSQVDPTQGGQVGSVGNGERSSGMKPGSPDTRGLDAIQTLLYYRKEVEKRRQLDTSYTKTDE
ncbi:hypothetical protein PHMEG_00018350 [Phytophthora megakarya]|uniref:Uncharacterized protein n=1 Tax=Phytophthora megakarya TaxID=4795 RepID=A0A225VUK1_9STRA|nr:hypothetical protein PHMEG_00018350 [Phytophthora megakarya]